MVPLCALLAEFGHLVFLFLVFLFTSTCLLVHYCIFL